MTSRDVFSILCREIKEASEGRVDAVRSNTICKLTDTAIRLARCQMEANLDEGRARGISLLADIPAESEADNAVERMSDVQRALAIVEKTLDDPKTDDAKRPNLRARANDLRQESLMLKRIIEKRK